MRFAMLPALLLALQGYAAMPACPTGEAAASLHAAAPHSTGAPHTAAAPHAAAATEVRHECAGADTTHHHNCGQCCCAAAIALTPVDFIAPHFDVPEIAASAIPPSPEGALDRLDRPPRLTLA